MGLVRRRATVAAIAVAATIVAVEAASLVAHRFVLGRWFSPAAFAGVRRLAGARPGEVDRLSPRLEPLVADDVVHPYVGFTGNPATNPGFSNLGFWGPLHWPPPRRVRGRALVGIFGGSFAAGIYDEGGDRLRARLAAMPRFAGREIVLLDMAYGGYKEPQQLTALAWLLAIGGELDALIEIDGFNEVALDAAENAPRGVFPPYPRAWALRVDTWTDPAALARLAEVARRLDNRSWAAGVFSRWPLRVSPAASLAWAVVDRRLARRVTDAQLELARAQSPRDSFRQTGVSPAVAMSPAERFDLLIGVWHRSSLALARLARSHGVAYWQFLQPNQYDEGSKPMGLEERRVAFRDDHPYRAGARAGYPRLRESAKTFAADGGWFVDLSRIFAREAAPLYADDCCHLTKAGYERFTDAMADAIARSDR